MILGFLMICQFIYFNKKIKQLESKQTSDQPKYAESFNVNIWNRLYGKQ